MASYDYYAKQYEKSKAKTHEEQKKQLTDYSNQAIENAVGVVEAQKETLPQQYQPYFDANEVQNLINQKQLEERMANLGLTDSGLNRTQETALAIQKQNTNAAYNQRKQAAIKSLDDQIAQIKANGQLQLQSNLLTLDQNYEASKDAYASSAYKADQEAAAKIASAKYNAINNLKLTDEEWAEAVEAYNENGEYGLADYAHVLAKKYSVEDTDMIDKLEAYVDYYREKNNPTGDIHRWIVNEKVKLNNFINEYKKNKK